jgi:DNA transformation protein and related proteins
MKQVRGIAMAVSQGFRDFVLEQLHGCGDITTRRMFGAVGIYAGDLFFAIIDKDVLYLKTDATTRVDFEREGSEPFRPYGDERGSMQYFSVPVSVLEDATALCAWGRKAIAVAAAARAERPARKRRTP